MSYRLSAEEYRQKTHKKQNKYRAKKTPVCMNCGAEAIVSGCCRICESSDTRLFDSKAEAKRYGTLKLLLDTGQISDLLLQEPFELVVEGVKIATYRADFSYTQDGKRIVEDVKGMDTPVSKLKRKLVAAIYGIEVTLITK